MKKTKIVGLGILCALGKTAEEVWENIGGNRQVSEEKKLPFSSFMSPSQKRRSDRYSDMTVYVANKAKSENKFVDEVPPERVGTLFSSLYSSLTSNLRFARSVREGDPDGCSPTLFAGTVPNACVGQLCIQTGFKGVSTTVADDGVFGYAHILLTQKKADYILAGSVEEYNEELFESNTERREGAGALLLTYDGYYEKVYAEMVDYSGCQVGSSFVPFNKDMVSRNLLQLYAVFANEKIDYVITSGKEIKGEEELFRRAGIDAPIDRNFSKLLGDTAGAELSLRLVIASLILYHKKIPFSGKETVVPHTILVTHCDEWGNYTAYLLQEAHKETPPATTNT